MGRAHGLAIALLMAVLDGAVTAQQAEPVFCVDFDEGPIGRAADGKPVQPLRAEGLTFVAGLTGQALRADAGMLVYPAAVVPKDAGTLELWASPLESGAGSGWYFFCGDAAEWGPEGVPRLWMYEGSPRLDVDGGGRLLAAGLPRGMSYGPGSWHQFAGTWDRRGNVALYMDGRLLGTRHVKPWEPAQRKGFMVGAGMHIDRPVPLYANALLDRVRIYDTVLPPEVIAAHYRDMGLSTLSVYFERSLFIRPPSDLPLVVENVGAGAWDGRIRWRSGERTGQVRLSVGPGERAEVKAMNALAPDTVGEFALRASWAEGLRGMTSRSDTLVGYVPPPLGPPPATAPEWRLVREVDCVQEPPVSEVGESRVVEGPAGAYREAGARCYDRFAYVFELSGRDRLLRLTVEHPDDAKRCTMLSHSIPDFQPTGVAGSEQQILGHGILSGGLLPLTNRMIARQYVFTCPSDRIGILVETGTTGQPAAAATLRLEEADGTYGPAARPPALGAADHRHAGLYWEDPVIAQDFGWTGTAYPRWDKVLGRAMDYLAWTGQDLLVYPTVWYFGPIYRSRFEPGTWPSGGRHHPPDYPRLVALRCAERGIQFVPTFTIWRLPSLAEWIRSKEEVIAGTPSVNTVNRDGEVLTETNWGSPPLLNAQHPRVQKAILDLIDEQVALCGDLPSFAGVGFALWPSSPMQVGARLVTSYDDWTLGAFARHIGEAPPDAPTDADRFKQRSEWILGDEARREKWVRWRCEEMTRFYAEAARHVAAAGPEAKLRLMIQQPYPQDEDPARQLLEQGLDLSALSRNPQIIIDRWMNQTAHRSGEKDGKDPATIVYDQVELTPEFQKPFMGWPRMSATIHQQYFESHAVFWDKAAPKLQFPAPWTQEGTGRCSQPTPWGRHFLRHHARSVFLYDAQWIAIGGFCLGTMGAEDEVRDFARAFEALPAAPFDDVGCTGPVVVRTAMAEGARWVYAVNITDHEAALSLKARSRQPRDAVSGRRVRCAGGVLDAILLPYELRVWRMEPEASVALNQPQAEAETQDEVL
jgi:hypothetical protein